ncbi:hypothetical protein V6N13_055661 [Hibiscus sabdariffa]|uniref:Uncharacterized protein n=1 Tax=Hibiscus sabdariffa TaxID=183260 RepID=A0ABR2BM38_9ROSI
MASLVLLLSELVRHAHHEPNFGFVAPPPVPSSCGASMSLALTDDASKYESEIIVEDGQELRVSVDLVWP